MNGSVMHLHQPIASLGNSSIVCSHQKRDALGRHKFEQQIEDHILAVLIQ